MATAKKFNVRHGLSAGTGAELKDVIDNVGKVIDVGTLPDLKTTAKTNTVAAINELYDDLGTIGLINETFEPMGIVNRAQSVISFNEGTRTFTIAPASGYSEFTVWTKAVKRTYTSAQNINIGASPASGLYYIYFNTSGVLSYRTTYFDWENDAMVAYVYWNATTNSAPFVADERHGIAMDWATHEYLHRTRGAVIANGFSLSNFTLVGNGSANADAQFDLGNGTFFDEDLEVNITHSTSPTVGTFTQVLQGAAEIPVFYHSGAEGEWVQDAPTEFAAKQSASTLQYNSLSGGTWSTTLATDNRYVISWVVATNNINYPIIVILGQAQYSSVGEAEATSFGELILTHFPVVEFRPLWKVIFRTSSGYTNTPNAYIANVLDIRQLGGESASGSIVSDHGLLTGLVDDDHSQYIHVNNTRTGVTAEFNTTGKITTTNSVGIGTTNPISKLSVGSTGTDRISIDWIGAGGPYAVAAMQANMQTGEVRMGAVNTAGTHFVTLYSDNSESVRINASGNVGIGTTNPEQKLHVQGSIRAQITGGGTGILLHSNTGWSAASNLAQFWTGQTEGFAFYANDSGNGTNERLRITASGNVGIGATNPGSKLTVNGYITESTDNGANYWNVVTQQDVGTSPNQVPLNQYLGQLAFLDDFSPNGLRAEGASTDSVVVSSIGATSFFGNVLIEASGAADKGSLTIRSNDSFIRLEDLDGVIDNRKWDIRNIGANNFTQLEFRTVNDDNDVFTPRVVFKSNGNVGIGIVDPSSILNVGSKTLTTNTDNQIILSGRFTGDSGTFASFYFKNSQDAGGSSASIRAIRGGDNYGTELALYTQIHGQGAGGDGVERLRVTSAGNVGIGTTSPVSGLQVTKYGSLFFPDSVFMQPAGNTFITARGPTGQDNWMGIGGHYYATTGSSNILLQANFGDTGSHAGHYISSTATAIGSSYFSIGRILASGSVDTPALKEPQLNISSAGNVGIGTTNPGYKLEVNGSFAATTKSFIIPHPTKESYKLRYGSLEGPENGVYVRGRSKNTVIELPEYWVKLVDEDSITVNLTPIGKPGSIWVERIEDDKIHIGREIDSLEYFYMVLAERVDVDKLEVEVPEAVETPEVTP